MAEGDGDGWVTLPDGTRRWGLFGAAGLLLTGHDPAGTGHVLLQHRAWWSHMGGTWGVPGGARDSGESAIEAALREFGEEVAGTLDGITLHAVHRQDHAVWTYDTVLARLPGLPVFARNNAESTDIRWVPRDEVPELTLLPPFAAAWPLLTDLLDRRLLLVIDARGTASDGGPPESGPGRAPGAGRTPDAAAALAAAGVPGHLLPPELPLPAAHHWYPGVRLLTDRPAPARPGVETVPVGGPSPEDARHAAEAPPGTAVLLVSPDARLRAACGGHGTVVAPLNWLDGARAAVGG